MTRLLVMLALMFSTPGATGTIQRNGTYLISWVVVSIVFWVPM